MIDNYGTHTSHCCAVHGCKYGDDDCPVELKPELAEHPCEQCDYEAVAVVVGQGPEGPCVLKMFTGPSAQVRASKYVIAGYSKDNSEHDKYSDIVICMNTEFETEDHGY